jgi:hypothetical protein
MKRFLAGVLVGIVLGTGVSALASGYYYSSSEYLAFTESNQNTYVAGVNDLATAIRNYVRDSGWTLTTLNAKVACLNADTLGAERSRASRHIAQSMSDGNYNAASVIINRACDP